MLVFPSLSYEGWKPIPDLPFWWNLSPSTKLYIATNRQRISRFRYFRGKKGKTTFLGEKRGENAKNSKFWIFYEKWPVWATFFSKIVPRFFPGSCSVLARFLPGSCPVLARFLPGSPRFTRNSKIFDRKEKSRQQNSEIFVRNVKDRKTRKIAPISLVWVNKTQKIHVLSCGWQCVRSVAMAPP